MPYRPDHKTETRARIVEAARMLFNRYGYDNVTIDMVMEAASLTRGGFYGHSSAPTPEVGGAMPDACGRA